MSAKRRRAEAGGRLARRAMGRAGLVVVLWCWLGPQAGASPRPSPGEFDDAGPFREVASRPSAPGRPEARVDRPRSARPSYDWTYRPTVAVRRGGSQGSGTIIASVDGEALILTAAHVVGESGPIAVELRRHNLGPDRAPASTGGWPQAAAAEVAAIDPAADLAVLRVEGLAALPYVARLSPPTREPAVDSLVTSIGIEPGRHLSGWSSRLVQALWFELNDHPEERLFLITARAPEHGRSGGGLFLPDGTLVGVCIGHAELVRGRRQGVFASRESIRQLLAAPDLAAAVSRSERARSRPGLRPFATP